MKNEICICNGRWLYPFPMPNDGHEVLDPECIDCINYIPGVSAIYTDGIDCVKENEND